jgi:pantoate--beta-alanine ligase
MTKILHTKQELTTQIAQWRQKGSSIGFVPTMGALHAGHLSLLAQARDYAEKTVASIFVNPLQFGPNEDFDRYPRHETRDIARLASMGVDAIYLPKAETMYPQGFATTITVAALGDVLCGAARPGHFDGVATVVAKLLLQVMPEVALFGEKDYQQLQIIRRMVKDLDLPVQIIGCTTIREADGLAMSSRNQYLSKEDRAIAPALYATLQATAKEIQQTPHATAALLAEGANALTHAGFSKVDYLTLCDAETLQPLNAPDRPARLLAAAFLGKTRLIDNIAV